MGATAGNNPSLLKQCSNINKSLFCVHANQGPGEAAVYFGWTVLLFETDHIKPVLLLGSTLMAGDLERSFEVNV